MKESMAMIAGMFGRRYTFRQKTAFINYISKQTQEGGMKVFLDESGQGGRQLCRNVYIGDPKKSDVIIAVPYDNGSCSTFRLDRALGFICRLG